jgi:hypothetical protein
MYFFLNISKTEFVKFNTKNAYDHDIKIVYDNMEIPNSSRIKFLGVNIVNTISFYYFSFLVHVVGSWTSLLLWFHGINFFGSVYPGSTLLRI